MIDTRIYLQQACRSVLIKNMIEGAWCCCSVSLASLSSYCSSWSYSNAIHPLHHPFEDCSKGDEGEQGTRDGAEAGTLWDQGSHTDMLLFAVPLPPLCVPVAVMPACLLPT